MAQETQRRKQSARPKAGSFRTKLEITNRSGWLTREYRLILTDEGIRIEYATGRIGYEIRYDPQRAEAVCTCPAFDANGECKHRDAVVALVEGLASRLGCRSV